MTEPEKNQSASVVDKETTTGALYERLKKAEYRIGRATKLKGDWQFSMALNFLIFPFAAIGIAFFPEGDLYVYRSEVLNQIELAIVNEADLRSVKQIFSNRDRSRLGLVRRFDNEKRYVEPITLVRVLEDLRADIFLREKRDAHLVTSIDTLLMEHNQINPFDRLDATQRIHFETLRSEIGDEYENVQPIVERIVDELYSKNLVVSEYLSDASASYRFSVVALFIAVLSAVGQLARMLRSQKKEQTRS